MRLPADIREGVWAAFWAVVLLVSLNEVRKVWIWALAPMPVASEAAEQYGHAWRINGQTKEADHISTSLPNYMGLSGFCVAGYDANDQLLWQINNTDKCEKVR